MTRRKPMMPEHLRQLARVQRVAREDANRREASKTYTLWGERRRGPGLQPDPAFIIAAVAAQTPGGVRIRDHDLMCRDGEYTVLRDPARMETIVLGRLNL